MVYRELIMEDIPHVMQLMHQLQCDQAKFDALITAKSPNFYLFEVTLHGVLEDELQAVYLAIDEGEIIGYIFGCICREGTAFSPLENYLYISDAYIAYEYRGKGNYKNLLTILETWALKNNCANAMFNMYVNNTSIQNIMVRYGYSPYKIQVYKKLF